MMGSWQTTLRLGVMNAVVVASACAAATSTRPADTVTDPETGFWPTPRMIELVVERIIDDVTRRYGLDERQQALYREQTATLIPSLLEKHRKKAAPLISAILSQWISGEVPDKEKVAEWSKTLLPIMQESLAKYDGVFRSMRPHLRPAQRTKWGRDHFYAKMGFALAEAKLRSYAQGQFEPKDWINPLGGQWRDPLPGPYQRNEDIIAAAKKAGMETRLPPTLLGGIFEALDTRSRVATTTEPADDYVPLNKWERHTKRFIRRYDLDEGQKTAALAILKELQQQAETYRASHSKDFTRLSRALRKAKGEAQTNLRIELTELERPLHHLFEELQTRLDSLLTESQRELTASQK
jgi:hypothetical protein